MRRRVWLARVAGGLAAVPVLASCGPGVPPGPAGPAGAEPLVRRPAQHLAIVLADLPAGFGVGQEMVAVEPGGRDAVPDPFGRLSAYAVTFARDASPASAGGSPGPPGGIGNVASSVNAYVGVAEAQAAFASWQAAVPPSYRRLSDPALQAPPGAAVYVQSPSGAYLIGFRSHNVIASVRVGPPSGGPGGAGAAEPAGEHAGTTHELATRLAALVARRIDAVAGR